MKKTFSTIEVARLLRASVKSVQRWIDQGRLEAGRTPGGHRRIGLEELLEFIKKQKLPVPGHLMLTPARLLVIDDEPDITEALAREITARHPDWSVAQAHDGFEAGGMLEATKSDVVILDLRVPHLDCYEVCRRIRKSAKATAVIAITPNYSPSVKKAILKCGAQACLPKPLEIDALMGEIQNALA